MTILRLAPTDLESYSMVSTLPRAMLSRFLSKPLGAAGKLPGVGCAKRGAARTKASAVPALASPIMSRFIAHPPQRNQGAFFRSSKKPLRTTRLFFEDALGEMVKIVAHFSRIVAIAVHVIDVGHALFFQVVVNTLVDAEQAVLVADSQPQNLQLLG